jgi:hypothetical protein
MIWHSNGHWLCFFIGRLILFLYSYEAEFVQKLLQDKKNPSRVLQPCIQIYRWCPINQNHNCHDYVHFIYHDELQIKDIIEYDKSVSYLYILLNFDYNGRLTITLYDRHDDVDFSIVNFPFLCSNIPLSSAYSVYISQLIRYTKACSVYEDF